MRIFYDTEFYEDGRTIELISIGAVRHNALGDAQWLAKEFKRLRP